MSGVGNAKKPEPQQKPQMSLGRASHRIGSSMVTAKRMCVCGRGSQDDTSLGKASETQRTGTDGGLSKRDGNPALGHM